MAFYREKNQKLLFKVDSIKNVSTLSKTDGLIRCATYNMAGNLSQQPGDRKRKSPDLRTGIVLKSGAKVERILRYAFSAECAKLNSAETRKGQSHRLAPLYQYLTEI